jgi:hypothetical protein
MWNKLVVTVAAICSSDDELSGARDRMRSWNRRPRGRRRRRRRRDRRWTWCVPPASTLPALHRPPFRCACAEHPCGARISFEDFANRSSSFL